VFYTTLKSDNNEENNIKIKNEQNTEKKLEDEK